MLGNVPKQLEDFDGGPSESRHTTLGLLTALDHASMPECFVVIYLGWVPAGPCGLSVFLTGRGQKLERHGGSHVGRQEHWR
ncbi:hypothetical protein GGTG_11998 [Gaeumannomyces tritici R3-111a-1]|uniref:Uncharacterized protein n=1 Tax=Gaeumannomyces tritici (strain R3-111a-1) TaxID=644352 RepID=J3PER8_GAET3|nr:hypothetical protein GGTG_11998 [Gaeumannomyces tritici R3-111a-1]EJT70976.1 hypothetical protein GGTG_11998 [Gaeumannomyces tritici R3-111a-1]